MMNSEMQRTCRLLGELLPAWLVVMLGAMILGCAMLAWPWPGLLSRTYDSTVEFVPALLLGALGGLLLWVGGRRMVRGDGALQPDQGGPQP